VKMVSRLVVLQKYYKGSVEVQIKKESGCVKWTEAAMVQHK